MHPQLNSMDLPSEDVSKANLDQSLKPTAYSSSALTSHKFSQRPLAIGNPSSDRPHADQTSDDPRPQDLNIIRKVGESLIHLSKNFITTPRYQPWIQFQASK